MAEGRQAVRETKDEVWRRTLVSENKQDSELMSCSRKGEGRQLVSVLSVGREKEDSESVCCQ